MDLSARNQLAGTVTAVTLGDVMAEVTVDIGASAPVVAVITRSSAESLGLEVGRAVVVVVKSTDVLLGTPTG